MQIQLIWSLQSRKTSVVWNNTDITFITGVKNGTDKAKNIPSVVEIAWQGSLGMNFRIVAHANASPGRRQYELFIGERSFFSLPLLTEIVSKERSSSARADYIVSGNAVECFNSNGLFECVGVEHATTESARDDINVSSPSSLSNEEKLVGEQDQGLGDSLTLEQQHRLASAGLSCFEPFDELRSDLYTSSLDALRAEMVSSLPQTEDMMSRAIIDAFSEDDFLEKNERSSRVSRRRHVDPIQVEADALWDAFEWINLNEGFADDPYANELRLRFMQEHVNAMVSHVRHETLSAANASKIMQRLAAVLDLQLKIPVPRDTVILSGLERDVNREHLANAMQKFGCVQASAVVKGRGFGEYRG